MSAGARHVPTELGETPPRVVLYTKPGCHLCDDARAVVAAVCDELHRRFGEQIPVTYVDGEQHDFWHVDRARLRAALT